MSGPLHQLARCLRYDECHLWKEQVESHSYVMFKCSSMERIIRNQVLALHQKVRVYGGWIGISHDLAMQLGG